MATNAVVKISGRQYIVHEGMEVVVDHINQEVNTSVELPVLMTFVEGGACEIGAPELKIKVQGEIIEQFKGDKIRVAKFKAKSRYHRANGYRPSLTRVRIGKI